MEPINQANPTESICILGIPLDKHSSYLQGPALAPPLIRAGYFCTSSNLWTETGLDLGGLDELFDIGDLDFSITTNAFDHITNSLSRLIEDNNNIICLGGDHAITYPIINAYAKYYQSLTILHLDAHPDLYDALDGDKYSHACPFARIMENKLAARLIQVGIRTMNGHQRSQAQKFNVEVHEVKDGLQWIDTLHVDDPIYLSLDLDCLDPAFAPGISHYEPGGLTTREVLNIIQQFPGKIIGADIVEYNPNRDINDLTAMVAAKMLKEIIGRIHHDRK